MRILFRAALAVVAGALPALGIASGASATPHPAAGFGHVTSSHAAPSSRGYRPELSVARIPFRASSVRPTATHNWFSPDFRSNAKKIYVSDAVNNVVDIFNVTGTLIGVLSGFSQPQGLAVDRQGNLYIADTNNSQIAVYDSGGQKEAPLADPGEYPVGVDVADNGTVGVTNICSVPSCGQGNIVYYAKGATQPTGTCDVAAYLVRVYFGGYDKEGNFFADGINASGQTEVVECLKGSSTPITTDVSGVQYPGGVMIHLVDGDLNVTDQNLQETDRFAVPGFSLVGQVKYNGVVDPVQPNPDKGNHFIWVPDAGTSNVYVYPYPTGGNPLLTIPIAGQPIGVAVFPRGDQ